MMQGDEKSDLAIVAMKRPNKAGRPAAEPRAGTKGNAGLLRGSSHTTLCRPTTRHWRISGRKSSDYGVGHSGDEARRMARCGIAWRSWPTTTLRNQGYFIPGQTSGSPPNTRGGSRMPKLGTSGSVRGARGNSRPYRDHSVVTSGRRKPLTTMPGAGLSKVLTYADYLRNGLCYLRCRLWTLGIILITLSKDSYMRQFGALHERSFHCRYPHPNSFSNSRQSRTAYNFSCIRNSFAWLSNRR